MVWDPLSKLHCCIRSDGGGAIVLTHEERARDCAKAPVWILGTGEAVSHTTIEQMEDLTESPCVRSGQLAFDLAGVTPEEIDTVQVYDAFHAHGDPDARRVGILQEKERRTLRRGRQAPRRWCAADQHGRWRSLSLPAGDARQCSCSSRPSSGWRGECDHEVPDAQLACVNGTSGWFTAAGTVIFGPRARCDSRQRC